MYLQNLKPMGMKTKSITLVVMTVFLLGYLTELSAFFGFGDPVGKPLPEFTHQNKVDWFNSEPLTIDELKGKVVLIDFWTFSCWNCYRSFPWLNDLEARLKDQPFMVIGVHSPEFEYEKNHDKIAQKIKKFNLHHPVMVDNDFSYWKAMNNRYWPTFYLVDKKGNIAHKFIGETHTGDKRAVKVEQAITQLLAEQTQ